MTDERLIKRRRWGERGRSLMQEARGEELTVSCVLIISKSLGRENVQKGGGGAELTKRRKH